MEPSYDQTLCCTGAGLAGIDVGSALVLGVGEATLAPFPPTGPTAGGGGEETSRRHSIFSTRTSPSCSW